MQRPVSLEARVEIWTREAMRLHGDDWIQIASFIQSRMNELPPATRKELEQAAALALVSPPQQSLRHKFH